MFNVGNREVKQKVHYCVWFLRHLLKFPSPERFHVFLSLATVSSTHSPGGLYEEEKYYMSVQGL